MLLADVTTPVTPPDLVSALAPWASLGASAVMTGLYVWLVTKRIPQQEAEHQATITRIMESHNATVKSLVEDYRAEHALDREQNAKLSDTMIQTLGRVEGVIGRSVAVIETLGRRGEQDG